MERNDDNLPGTDQAPRLPEGWPKTGTLDGKPVDLEEALRTMDPTDLGSIVVDVPGLGPSQPWKQSAHHIDDDGTLYI